MQMPLMNTEKIKPLMGTDGNPNSFLSVYVSGKKIFVEIRG